MITCSKVDFTGNKPGNVVVRKASEHIDAMRDDLAGNSKDHKSFLCAMTKLQNAS
jgi:hypothetical protein